MTNFAQYELLKRLSVGGMAEIYLARRGGDLSDELVVIKRILPELKGRDDFKQMFLDEARLTWPLSHANLVKVLEVGEFQGVYFIAMEYVDGLPLSGLLDRLVDRRPPLEVSIWLMAEACAGLSYAHQHRDAQGRALKIVHRDISPGNILISRGGEVKLADFGIAKATVKQAMTRPGMIKGKLAYMSPEQGLQRHVDQRSDIFSLGLVLYEITTGQAVFPYVNELHILRALRDREYLPPEEVMPSYPPRLAAVVNKALAWEPGERYPRAAEMHADLMGLVDPEAELAAEVAQVVNELVGKPIVVQHADAPQGLKKRKTRPMPRSAFQPASRPQEGRVRFRLAPSPLPAFGTEADRGVSTAPAKGATPDAVLDVEGPGQRATPGDEVSEENTTLDGFYASLGQSDAEDWVDDDNFDDFAEHDPTLADDGPIGSMGEGSEVDDEIDTAVASPVHLPRFDEPGWARDDTEIEPPPSTYEESDKTRAEDWDTQEDMATQRMPILDEVDDD